MSPLRFSTTAIAALVAGGLGAASALAAPLLVTSAANNGPGTLRAALEAASRSGDAATIVIGTAVDIELANFLNYWGTEPREIIGSGQTIIATRDFTVLNISQGADVTIMNLTFARPGGFDIDQAGPGSMIVSVTGAVMTNNLDEGFDFDEEDGGDIFATYVDTEASGNTHDAYKHSEEGEGGVFGLVAGSCAVDNGGVGFVFEEEGDGDVGVAVLDSATDGNDDGDLGLEVVQEDGGAGALLVACSDISEGIEADGVTLQDDMAPVTE